STSIYSVYILCSIVNVESMIVWLGLFFFSSRRRHTRSKRDWSSDVCSSDLASVFSDSKSSCSAPANPFKREIASSKALSSKLCRSEERRVGKECRSRWARDNEKKKKKEEKI